MKSSKLSESARAARRSRIMEKRADMIIAHKRSTVQYYTTKFDKHSSKRQRARYARQTGYVAPAVTPAPPAKPKRVRKTASA